MVFERFWTPYYRATLRPRLLEFYHTYIPDLYDTSHDWFYLRIFQAPAFFFGIWFGAHMNYKWWGTYLPFEGEKLRALLPPEAIPEYLEDNSGETGIYRFLPWKSEKPPKREPRTVPAPQLGLTPAQLEREEQPAPPREQQILEAIPLEEANNPILEAIPVPQPSPA